MTKKRFIYCEEENGEFPFPYIKYDCKKVISLYECVDVLNEQHEEIAYLEKKKCDYWNKYNQAYLDSINFKKENEQLKFENNELKCALALDEVDYIIADGKKIDIPPYYEFEQRYDSVMHRREYDGYD